MCTIIAQSLVTKKNKKLACSISIFYSIPSALAHLLYPLDLLSKSSIRVHTIEMIAILCFFWIVSELIAMRVSEVWAIRLSSIAKLIQYFLITNLIEPGIII